MFFSILPATVIATDLLHATVTKTVRVFVHGGKGSVNWATLKPLWLGGLLGAGAGIGLVVFSVRADFADEFLRIRLAFVTLLATCSILCRQFGHSGSGIVVRPQDARNTTPLALGEERALGWRFFAPQREQVLWAWLC